MTYSYQTHYVNLGHNNRIAYIDEGAGEKTLLFIHGLANYAMVWKKNIEVLKQSYRCIALDLPGNGLSAKADDAYGIGMYADAVYHFVDKLGLSHLTLVGHSMGGQVAMAALLRQPHMAQKLVLCAPAGLEHFTAMEKSLYFNGLRILGFLSTDENSLRHVIENSFYRYQAQGEQMIRDLNAIMKTYKLNLYRKMVELSIKSMLDEPVDERLEELRLPALVLFGRNDGLIPNRLLHHMTTEQLARDAVKRMPHAQMDIFADCGHFVQWEKADEVNRAIEGFVGKGR